MSKIIGIMLLMSVATLSHAAPGPAAPEIDPASGASALALLTGATLIIRGRRKK